MTDQPDPTPQAEPPAPLPVQWVREFEVSLEGQPYWDEWRNTVTVNTVTGAADPDDPSPHEDEAEDASGDVLADWGGDQQLVCIDTNYKPGRTGQHPVALTRTDAVALAVAVLEAVEDTFAAYVGRLRAEQGARLLTALDNVQDTLTDLRRHALEDLLHSTGLDPAAASTPPPAGPATAPAADPQQTTPTGQEGQS